MPAAPEALDDGAGPVAIAQELIRCPSVTPDDGGCVGRIERLLGDAGFQVDAFSAGAGEQAVRNLIACHGSGDPVLAFAGHTDVVPPGARALWSQDPFSAAVVDGELYGRGAVDMKGALAAFLAATQTFVRGQHAGAGTLMIMLTGDEEVGGEHGMRAVLGRMAGRHPTPHGCLIGEPSCEGAFGQGIRIGRRGSVNVEARARGVQGHVAWPERADNALHRLLHYLRLASAQDLGPATACFPASNLEITSVSADSPAANMIPGQASARLNVRFNTRHSGAGLTALFRRLAAPFGGDLTLEIEVSGEPYLFDDGHLSGLVAAEVERVAGRRPQRNAGGGVSDGRFIRALCPVVEFGLVGDLAHKANERVPIAHLYDLERVYLGVLRRFFAPDPT